MNWIFRSAKSIAVELNEEVGDEKHCKAIPMASRMAKLKIALQKHINLPPGTCETETYLVYQALVPQVYSKSELDFLLLNASKMDDWFLCANYKTAIFNPKNIQLD